MEGKQFKNTCAVGARMLNNTAEKSLHTQEADTTSKCSQPDR